MSAFVMGCHDNVTEVWRVGLSCTKRAVKAGSAGKVVAPWSQCESDMVNSVASEGHTYDHVCFSH